MPITNSYSFLVGPLMAALALGVIVLLCRWVFSTTTRDQRLAARQEQARTRGSYGLLVPVASAPSREDGELLRAVLVEADIRCTLTPTEAPDAPFPTPTGAAGRWTVLVFRADVDRARELVSS